MIDDFQVFKVVYLTANTDIIHPFNDNNDFCYFLKSVMLDAGLRDSSEVDGVDEEPDAYQLHELNDLKALKNYPQYVEECEETRRSTRKVVRYKQDDNEETTILIKREDLVQDRDIDIINKEISNDGFEDYWEIWNDMKEKLAFIRDKVVNHEEISKEFRKILDYPFLDKIKRVFNKNSDNNSIVVVNYTKEFGGVDCEILTKNITEIVNEWNIQFVRDNRRIPDIHVLNKYSPKGFIFAINAATVIIKREGGDRHFKLFSDKRNEMGPFIQFWRENSLNLPEHNFDDKKNCQDVMNVLKDYNPFVCFFDDTLIKFTDTERNERKCPRECFQVNFSKNGNFYDREQTSHEKHQIDRIRECSGNFEGVDENR